MTGLLNPLNYHVLPRLNSPSNTNKKSVKQVMEKEKETLGDYG